VRGPRVLRIGMRCARLAGLAGVCFMLVVSAFLWGGRGEKGSLDEAAEMSFVEDAEASALTVRDHGVNVLTYHYGEHLPAATDPRYARSCYIHPLFSPDGEVLTADFPADHLHHHGLFWAWPVVFARGIATQTWAPADPSLRQRFVGWRERDIRGGLARLRVENNWTLDGREVLARETVTIIVHPLERGGRAIDVELLITPVGGPLELRGSPEENKGYGGLCFRGAPLFKGAALTTDLGPLDEDSVDRRFRWADLSTARVGVAIFVSPAHPGYPTMWLVRTSYAGILNPAWPGLEGVRLQAGKSASLRYRLYAHRGDVAAGGVEDAYKRYISEEKAGSDRAAPRFR
jgi:hypothetical protein